MQLFFSVVVDNINQDKKATSAFFLTHEGFYEEVRKKNWLFWIVGNSDLVARLSVFPFFLNKFFCLVTGHLKE